MYNLPTSCTDFLVFFCCFFPSFFFPSATEHVTKYGANLCGPKRAVLFGSLKVNHFYLEDTELKQIRKIHIKGEKKEKENTCKSNKFFSFLFFFFGFFVSPSFSCFIFPCPSSYSFAQFLSTCDIIIFFLFTFSHKAIT